MTTKIYVLTEPDGWIRYVGKTVKFLRTRFSEHLSDARHGKTGHRCNWIRSLLSKGFLPMVQFVGEVEGDGCKEEIAWIKYFRNEGVNLVNDTDGGEGMLGNKVSDKTRNKLSQSHKGQIQWNTGMKMPQEYCDKLALAQIKRFSDPQERKRFRLACKGHVISSECREKIRLTNTGHKVSEVAREKISVAFKGKKLSKEKIERRKILTAEYWKMHPKEREILRQKRKSQMLRYWQEKRKVA